MKKLNINGIELAYTRRGEGTPLMLIHGYPLDGSIWKEVAPLLEGKFDLITPDLRGFGESTTVDTPYKMDDYASDIVGLLDHLGIQKTAIAGHSMGGYVALAFARLYPERVSGLGLVSSQVLADPPERKQGRYDTAAQVAEKGVGVVVEAMTPKFTSDEHIQTVARRVMERQKSDAVTGALKAMAERPDSTSLLTSFAFQIVLIHGDADLLIPIDRAREVKALLPKSHLVELKNIGHVPMLEAVHETAQALIQLG